jgi:uroporphyrinogen-III synthase
LTAPSFNNLRVLTLESRRGNEMATLISNYGGRPLSAPALREVPLESNPEALAFADGLVRDEFDLVILLTGVGTRALLAVVDKSATARHSSSSSRTSSGRRGPKPVAAARARITPWLTAPEPNTWRELLERTRLEGREQLLQGARLAVQEYGVSNEPLLQGLRARGARVTTVPVYRWALPEDVEPLRVAARGVAGGEVDVALFTTATQVVHLLQVAQSIGLEPQVREGLASVAVASIGPTTSEELREQGIPIDIEASHPKMGFLVREAAEHAADVLRTKGSGGAAIGSGQEG